MSFPETNWRRRLGLASLLVLFGLGLWLVSTQLNARRSPLSDEGSTAFDDASTGASASASPSMLVASQQAFAALRANTPPRRLLRLIAYDPATQSNLSIAQLQTLGAPRQRYVFVADYDELRGCAVATAVRKAGQPVLPGQHVSAIVFPAGERQVFPANARGVLQVLQAIDAEHSNSKISGEYRLAAFSKYLSPPELAALADRDSAAGAWENWRPYFSQYRDAVETLRTQDKASAFELMGHIDSDWSPLGYAQVRTQREPTHPTFELPLANGRIAPAPDFGARVFLTPNAKLTELQGQWLLDFERPEEETLP